MSLNKKSEIIYHFEVNMSKGKILTKKMSQDFVLAIQKLSSNIGNWKPNGFKTKIVVSKFWILYYLFLFTTLRLTC